MMYNKKNNSISSSSISLFAGTVIRGAPVRNGGDIFHIDWSTKSVMQRKKVFPCNPDLDHDTNPRGNTRGCRGIAINGDKNLVFLNYHTVEVADRQLNRLQTFSDFQFAGLHEVYVLDSDHIWVAATAIDSAHKLQLSTGRVVERKYPRESPSLRAVLDIEPSNISRDADVRASFLRRDHTKHKSHLHFNAVCQINGRLVGLFNRFGAICDLDTNTILVRDKRMIKAHNIAPISKTQCLVNDTRGAAVLTVSLEKGSILKAIELKDFPVVREIEREAIDVATRLEIPARLSRPLFVRGLSVLNGSVFVGLSPATILEIDLHSGELSSYMVLSENPTVCIHGLAACQT